MSRWLPWSLLLLLSAGRLQAHDGPHPAAGEPSAPLAALSPALTIDQPPLELVARYEGEALLIYLDDYASNAPLDGLQLQLASGGQRLQAEALGEGRYRIPAELLDRQRPLQVRISVQGPGLRSELAGELPAAPAGADQASDTAGSARRWGWLLAPLGLGLLALSWRRRTRP